MEGQRANAARIESLLCGVKCEIPPERLEGRVGFRTLTPDRLPLIGALPDTSAPLKKGEPLESVKRNPGLFGILGMGSRGALWSTLAGELLASQVCGEPLPLPLDLVRAMDPARFFHREATR
jgi:tRNA 5-methylaminomethyl-2-thiouridine biosynthesis bifunctional protein